MLLTRLAFFSSLLTPVFMKRPGLTYPFPSILKGQRMVSACSYCVSRVAGVVLWRCHLRTKGATTYRGRGTGRKTLCHGVMCPCGANGGPCHSRGRALS